MQYGHISIPAGTIKLPNVRDNKIANIPVPGLNTYGSLFDGALKIETGNRGKRNTAKSKGWNDCGYTSDDHDTLS